MDTHLVISALGSDKPGIVDSLAKTVAAKNCNIEDSRMTVLGGEFAVIMLVQGDQADIASLVEQCPALEQELGLTILTRQTSARAAGSQHRPYDVEVVALDNPGIVHELSSFFSKQHINIEDLKTSTYAAPHTGTEMFTLKMIVSLPPGVKVSELREEFLHYCDERNLDASIEPTK